MDREKDMRGIEDEILEKERGEIVEVEEKKSVDANTVQAKELAKKLEIDAGGQWEKVPREIVESAPRAVASYSESWSTPNGASGFSEGVASLERGVVVKNNATWDRYASSTKRELFGGGKGYYNFFVEYVEMDEREKNLRIKMLDLCEEFEEAWKNRSKDYKTVDDRGKEIEELTQLQKERYQKNWSKETK